MARVIASANDRLTFTTNAGCAGLPAACPAFLWKDSDVGVWGKLGGAGVGFALGGPLGALIGAVVGHVAIDATGLLDPPDKDVIFTTGLVALTAKMARADGYVSEEEIRAFRRIVVVPEEDVEKVERLFALAHQTTYGYEAYARQIAEAFGDEPLLLEDVVDALYEIAKADHAIHEAERAYVRNVAAIFGFDDEAFDIIEARHVERPDDPWKVLGLPRGATTDEVKRRYRQLAAELHPDRQIAHGLPEEAIKVANDHLAAVNAAYDRIMQQQRRLG